MRLDDLKTFRAITSKDMPTSTHIQALRDEGWTVEPPPAPDYEAVPVSGGGACVWDNAAPVGRQRVVLYEGSHPDPLGAAEAEVERLKAGAA